MLSYRHAFHAGNHADVLKHIVLIQTAQYLAQKDKPFWLIDTHAGAGAYQLDSEYAQKRAEFRDGIARLWPAQADMPAAVSEYLSLVRRLNTGEKLRHYPGSPWLAAQCLRPDDRLRLFELHSTDARLLKKLFPDAGRQISVTEADGLAGLKALLPPPPRRALVLIDPSYEVKSDYTAIPAALNEAIKRFAAGTYAIWYPQLARPESRSFPDKLKKAAGSLEWLHVTLSPLPPPKNGIGMYGSGMFIINPPWTLAETLSTTLPWLAERLGGETDASGLQKPARFLVERNDQVLAGQESAQRKRPNRHTDQA